MTNLKPILATKLWRLLPPSILKGATKGICEGCGEDVALSEYARNILSRVDCSILCMDCGEKELPTVSAIVLPPQSEIDRVTEAVEEHERRN